MDRLNHSFDSYVHRQRKQKPQKDLNNTSFFARTNVGVDSFSRKVPPIKHSTFPPTMTLAEYNQVSYQEKNKTPVIPDLNAPQRIKLPPYFNTPTRILTAHKENRSISPNKTRQHETSFQGDTSFLGLNSLANETVFGAKDASPINKYDKKVNLDIKVGAIRRIKDYTLLSQACRRAGKTREEGRAYYSMGVLYDNMQEYQKAIKYYKKFMILCQTINDANGEALAYNCLAVNYQHLGDEGNTAMYEQAIKYHTRHKDVGDTSGKFTACVNLGLVYAKLGDAQNASIFQQHALRLALELSNALSQSLAIGNLGKIGTFEMPTNRGRIQQFIEKYLQLCKDLNNKEGEGNGYLKLGQMLSDQKKFDEGLEKYERAYQIGIESENNETVAKAKFGYGITSGLSKMDTHLDSFKKKIGLS